MSSRAVQSPKTKQPMVEDQRHEELCTQCGKCCYKKIIVANTVFMTPFPCEFLDMNTQTCREYERRFEVNPECLNVSQALAHGALPADCGYVPVYAPAAYRPAVDTWSWKGQWMDFDELADLLEVSEETREKIRARGPFAPPPWEDPRAEAPSLVALVAEAGKAGP